MPNKRSTPQSVGTFREAFRQAKDSGVKTFMWKGKKYNTKAEFDADVADPNTDTTNDDFSQHVEITVASLTTESKTKD